MQYLLTADEILSKVAKLNGEVLKLKPDDTLPEIQGMDVQAGELMMPSKSIMFLTFNKFLNFIIFLNSIFLVKPTFQLDVISR